MTENKIVTEDDAVQQIKEIMIKRGYSQVTKTLYHKNKKKVEHGVWKIGKHYYYFLKNKKENSFFLDEENRRTK